MIFLKLNKICTELLMLPQCNNEKNHPIKKQEKNLGFSSICGPSKIVVIFVDT